MSFITTPFSWLLLQLYYLLGNYGLALMTFALVISLIRLPFDFRGKRSTMRTSLLAPQVNRLKERHGENTPKYNEELQKLYKQENINPMSGCLWSLLPLAIVLILYQVVRLPLTHTMGLSEDQISKVIDTLSGLGVTVDNSGTWYQIYAAEYISKFYEQVKAVVPEVINLNLSFFGISLGAVPSYQIWEIASWSRDQIILFFLPVVSAGLSVISQKLSMSTSFTEQDKNMAGTMKSMMIIGPIMSLWIGYSFPVAISLYWLASNFMTMVSTFFFNKHFKKEYLTLTKERDEKMKEKEAEIEAKRRETERLRAINATKENQNTSKKNKKKQEKQKEMEQQAEENRKNKKETGSADEPSRVGNRPFARGRSYDPGRFNNEEPSGEKTDMSNVVESALSDHQEAESLTDGYVRFEPDDDDDYFDEEESTEFEDEFEED